jgi:uncharacterized protein (DUF934 family)
MTTNSSGTNLDSRQAGPEGADSRDTPLPAAGRAVVTLARWQAERATLAGVAPKVGVLLPNTADLAEVWPAIADRDLLWLSFPAFGDGRAYSQARLLRERYGYAGEMRATGAAVVVDQAAELLRCGFDAFALRDDQQADAFIARLAAARTRTWYQRPAAATPVFALRRGS